MRQAASRKTLEGCEDVIFLVRLQGKFELIILGSGRVQCNLKRSNVARKVSNFARVTSPLANLQMPANCRVGRKVYLSQFSKITRGVDRSTVQQQQRQSDNNSNNTRMIMAVFIYVSLILYLVHYSRTCLFILYLLIIFNQHDIPGDIKHQTETLAISISYVSKKCIKSNTINGLG